MSAAADIRRTVAPRRRRSRAWRVLRVLAIGLALLLLLGLLLLATPLLDRPPPSNPRPAESYRAAMARADRLLAADGPDVAPACRSRVLDHGRRTRIAVVLLHGYTSCPQQWDRIARAYAAQGVSVVVPRLPAHGLADRLTREPAALTPAALAAAADEAVDIASGLGESVHVVGASAGGALATWLASHRTDVDRLTLISPLAAPQPLPALLVKPAARAVRLLPDAYLWWDDAQRERLATPPYAYPGFSTDGLGAFLEVAGAVATVAPPVRLDPVTLVVNENDSAVSLPAARRAAADLQPITRTFTEHVFPASAGLGHDLVDPAGENAARIEEVYAALGPLLDLPGLAGR